MLYLKRLEFLDEHLVVGIARNQHHIVELAEEGQLVGLEGKPHVDALLDDGCLALFANLAQVFVVEDALSQSSVSSNLRSLYSSRLSWALFTR